MIAASVWISGDALAQSTLFRYDDLDLRDPHVFVNFLGCRDVTDTLLVGFSVNNELQTNIQTDGDGDGFLDLSSLVEFLPLDQGLATNLIDTGTANCTAPLATTACGPITSGAIAGDATLLSAGQCLAPIAGTARPYSPSITNTSSPCFLSPMGTLVLDLGGIPITLRDSQLAATFVDTPAIRLANGLVRGFISEADANATVIPSSFPLIGGQTLSSLLPGGNGSCASHSDKDLNNGISGWWFYLNYTAPRVAVDTFATGFADSFE